MQRLFPRGAAIAGDQNSASVTLDHGDAVGLGAAVDSIVVDIVAFIYIFPDLDVPRQGT